MRITRTKLKDAKQTGRFMHIFVNYFFRDMAPYATLSYPALYDLIKKIPFRFDPEDEEVLKRPYYTMHMIGPGGDCDDKSIAVGAWAKLVGIPYRFVGVGNKDGKIRPFGRILLSHVYTELYIDNKWLPFDTTYGFNILGTTLQKYDKRTLL